VGQSSKTLRPYQARLLTDVCRATGDILVEQPTGSGKTMQIVTLVAMQLGRRFTHALISAPQEQIEHGFVHRDYHRVEWSPHAGVAVPAVEVPEHIILASRRSDLGSVRQIRSYLRLQGPLDHALACTHASLTHLSAEHLPADLSGKALFVDEAHHASADGLSQIVAAWRDRGGQLYFFTATPYRGDGRPVKLDGMKPFRRSLAEHMAEGFAPQHLDSEIVALGKPGDAITAGQFSGEDAPPRSYFDALVNAISHKWLDDGKPKAIVRVPPMRGGSGGLISGLKQAFETLGARVLDATGTGVADKERFLDALKAEQGQNHARSRYDVMVGIQRVFEGTDWPVCSAAYCVGMPGSLNTVVQFLGRAMRLKAEDYPAAYRNRVRLAFFVPCAGGEALADLSLDHSRHALLTCCFLADHQVGQEWIVLREVRRGIEEALGPRGESAAAADAENEADEPLDPEVRAEVELAMASAREQIVSNGGEPTLGEVVRRAAQNRPDLPEAALHRVAAEILAAQPGPSGDKTREKIHQEVARKLRIDPRIKKALEEVFAVVLKEFRAVTLDDSAVLESVRRQVHGVTGGQMREFAQRLRDAAPRPLTEEMILAWADAHHEQTGDWPKTISGPVHGLPDETWGAIHSALQQGGRGLPGGSSLAKMLAEQRGVRNKQDLPLLSVENILAWADSHYQRTKKWPTQTAGAIVDAPGETWQSVQMALWQGLRGLPGGSTLAQLLTDHRGLTHHLQRPKFTVEQILSWADAHHGRTGKWPTDRSGSVVEAAPGETWKRIDRALQAGVRGLPGESSLARLLVERREKRNHMKLPPLTVEQILTWADMYHQRTGTWPNQKSGDVVGAPGERWQSIDAALLQGHRSLPGGSSLARLLAEHRGVRNAGDPPNFTVSEILSWVDAHKKRTGEWPRVRSGPVSECPDETWRRIDNALVHGLRGLPGGSSLARFISEHRADAVLGAPTETWSGVNAALERGHRGLSGGSSLAKLLAERRGVRNQASPPQLSAEQVLAWADAHREFTGSWPTRESGSVDAVHGETWSGIDAALKMGTRGLPGGSSLAQLLAEHRGVRNIQDLPILTVEQILSSVDADREETGKWPTVKSGPIKNAFGETWASINHTVAKGGRGLPGGSSLAQLLATHRGVRNSKRLPPLSEELVLDWVDAHHARTSDWPTHKSGPILEAPGETWRTVDKALRNARRGITVKTSLARLLAEHRGVRNPQNLPSLAVQQILAWVDAHEKRTGEWPTANSGPVADVAGETWANVEQALAKGLRGLSGGSSLARLLAEHREVRNMKGLLPLSVEKILSWADGHQGQNGQWPTRNSGPIADVPSETWANVNQALVKGLRSLPGGSSLARLLAENRGVRNIQALPRLLVDQIYAWVCSHHQRTNRWPTSKSGSIADAPGETWANVDQALVKGLRGLPGGSSLARLIKDGNDKASLRKPLSHSRL